MTYLMVFTRCFTCFFSDYLSKSICCGYSFESRQQVDTDTIQIGTHNICLYKVDKKYTGCNLKTPELLDCAFKMVCMVIRLNTIFYSLSHTSSSVPFLCDMTQNDPQVLM